MRLRLCAQCGNKKKPASFYNEDSNDPHEPCRSCVLLVQKKVGRKPGTRRIGGQVVTAEQVQEMRREVELLGGRVAPTDIKGMIAFLVQHKTKGNCLAEASEVVDGPRRATYGHPAENHTRTAMMFSAYLGIVVTPRMVCMLNALQKISRDRHADHHDNLVDLAGWARNAEMCTPEEYVDGQEAASAGRRKARRQGA